MKVRGLLIIILIGIVAPLFLITVLRDSQANSETIAIIGTGNVGSTLGKIWAAKGHEIIYGSRTPTSTRVQQLVRESGKNAMSTTQADAARRADVVMIPIPPTAIPEVIDALGNLEGKLIIDTTNWWGFEGSWATSPRDPRESLAEQVQALAPEANVVKAFNTMNYAVMADPSVSDGPVTVPIAGNSSSAKARVAALVEDVGLEPLDVGPLAAAEYLEEMLRLAIGFREINPGVAFDYHLRLRPN
ncbi:MAG: NADPH-dependent F420 reductase [Pseudomonadota bacterium]|nr:NADPH-dependent F420 reductase [Pseudomonadota bacterium]